MSSISDFIEKASRHTRNPLGIIALFISLIYGFACLVLSVSLDHLKTPVERLPLIWFIILFPILILVAFVFLVIFHHTKLYSPSDFKDENNFIKSIGLAERKLRVEQEVETIKEDIKENRPTENIGSNEKNLDGDTQANTKIVDNKAIKNNYVLAETLALNKFEEDHNISLQRHSKLVGVGKSLEFDAIGLGNDILHFIDVKYTIHNYLSKILQERIEDGVHGFSKEIKRAGVFGQIKLVIIIVSERSDVSSIKEDLQSLDINVAFDFEIEVYSLNELKRRYGIMHN